MASGDPRGMRCRDDMSREDAIKLVAKAIRSGIFNDLGSGSNVDICVIETNDKAALPPSTCFDLPR